MTDRVCSAPGCAHVHDVQCLLMSIASGGVRRVAHERLSAPYGMPGTVIVDEAFHERVGLWEELQTTIARLSRSGGSSAGAGKGSESPVPYHARASAVAHRMRNELSTWARALAGERQDLELPPDYPPAVARWLAEELAVSFVPAELATGIREVVHAAERVIDHGPDRIFVGRCETPLTDEGRRAVAKDPDADVSRCQADVYARRDKGFVPCRECGAVHDVAYRKRWLEQHLAGSLVTAGEAAPYLSWLTDKPIKVDTIHKWRTRAGRLQSQEDATGRRLYRFRDLLALAQEVRTRNTGPRDKEGSAA
jgi:hypothetical protein